jgi:hypothetical protein
MVAGAAAASGPDPFEQLTRLKTLLDSGAITPDEFTAKKKDILARM